MRHCAWSTLTDQGKPRVIPAWDHCALTHTTFVVSWLVGEYVVCR
ncbi:MAG: hypothetical protein WD716_06120 [Fimbriimonadaceae bacterium]